MMRTACLTALTLTGFLTSGASALSLQDGAVYREWEHLSAKLEKPGAEPRVELRRRPRATPLELEYRLDQRVRLEAKTASNNMSKSSDYPLLGVHLVARSEAGDDGALRCSIEIKDAVHAEEQDMADAVRRDVGDQVKALKELRLSWGAKPNGAVKDKRARVQGNLWRPDLAMVLMDELSLDWYVTLPEEPVGVGAVWSCTGALPARMVNPKFRAQTTLTLTVTDIVDGEVLVDVDVNRTPAVLGNVAGERPSATDYLCEGSGSLRIDQASGMVTQASMQRSIDASLPVGDTGRSMNLHIDIVSLVIPRDQLPAASRVGATPVDAAKD